VANELILVVEDNDKNRKLVRDVLTFKGYEIIEAETGEEGVRLAQERRPSLVLMDIRLPGIDGRGHGRGVRTGRGSLPGRAARRAQPRRTTVRGVAPG